MRFVFNREDGDKILGKFVGYDESVVLYTATHNGSIRSAPDDCVTVREVGPDAIREVLDRFKRRIDSNAAWIGDGTEPTTAMNGILALGVEMIEYAQIFQAALTVDQAYAELRRRADDGVRVGAATHADLV